MTTLRARTALLVGLVLVVTTACGGDGGGDASAPGAGSSASTAPSSSPSSLVPSPVAPASAQTAAGKINLTAADLPGYTATPADEKVAESDAAQAAADVCVGVSPAEPVAKFASDDFAKGPDLPSVQLATTVSFAVEAATTKADLAAFSSDKTTTCLATFAADVSKTIGEDSGITFGTPEVTKLTPTATGVDGAFGYSVSTSATAQGKTFPFTIEILGAGKGRTRLTLTAIAVGGSVPAAERDALFTTLVQRTSANAL